jgi:hypothetical protein
MFRPEIATGDFVGNANIIGKLPWLRSALTSDFASKQYPLIRCVFGVLSSVPFYY